MRSIEAQGARETRMMDVMDDGKVTAMIGAFVVWWSLASERSELLVPHPLGQEVHRPVPTRNRAKRCIRKHLKICQPIHSGSLP
jgi:hypothetical protein